MADTKFITYKGFPLVRKGNEIYYGNMSDETVACLNVMSSHKEGDLEVADKIMVALMSGKIDTQMIYCFKTARIEFESEVPVAWTLDGEFGGDHEKVMVWNNTQALTIMVPSAE